MLVLCKEHSDIFITRTTNSQSTKAAREGEQRSDRINVCAHIRTYKRSHSVSVIVTVRTNNIQRDITLTQYKPWEFICNSPNPIFFHQSFLPLNDLKAEREELKSLRSLEDGWH